jgi:hypothetical protein
MRTTLTLEDDLARRLQELAHQQRKPFKEVVNETIRAGLEPHGRASAGRFEVRPHDCGLLPGVDPRRLNELSDRLEGESFAAEETRER